jgi:hypothetical protein
MIPSDAPPDPNRTHNQGCAICAAACAAVILAVRFASPASAAVKKEFNVTWTILGWMPGP